MLTPGHICTQWVHELKKHIAPAEDDYELSEGDLIEGQIHGVRYVLYPGIATILKSIPVSYTHLTLPTILRV